jgi:peptidoglycan/xylan/chitin deacetylase (PgdA/CDA1 family)
MENQLYSYSPIHKRPKLELPNGARLAFWIGLNIEHFEIGKPSTSIHPGTAGLTPDPLNHGWRDYGARVGIWRMIEQLDAHGIRPSALVNSMVCDEYPQIIEAGRERGWAWCGHGRTNSRYWTGMEIDEEREELAAVVTRLEEATGSRPAGWLAPALTTTANTPALLAEQGFTYIMDWCADDQPFPLRPELGRMISVPYAIEVNDIVQFLGMGATGRDFAQVVRDQFDCLHREAERGIGSAMCLAIHPFVLGQPFRARYLDEALAHICAHDDVWITTSDEIAAWYLEHHYDGAVAAG